MYGRLVLAMIEKIRQARPELRMPGEDIEVCVLERVLKGLFHTAKRRCLPSFRNARGLGSARVQRPVYPRIAR